MKTEGKGKQKFRIHKAKEEKSIVLSLSPYTGCKQSYLSFFTPSMKTSKRAGLSNSSTRLPSILMFLRERRM